MISNFLAHQTESNGQTEYEQIQIKHRKMHINYLKIDQVRPPQDELLKDANKENASNIRHFNMFNGILNFIEMIRVNICLNIANDIIETYGD